jgi:hypothetical protein
MSDRIPGFFGDPLQPIITKGDSEDKWVQVYNNTGVDIANGAPKSLVTYSYLDANSVPHITYVPIAIATNAAGTTLVGVVDNDYDPVVGTPLSVYAGIKAGDTGWAKVKGIVYANCYGDTDIVIGDQLEVLNASPTYFTMKTSASSGVAPVTGVYSAAVALDAYTVATVTTKRVYLTGQRVTIE